MVHWKTNNMLYKDDKDSIPPEVTLQLVALLVQVLLPVKPEGPQAPLGHSHPSPQ